MLARVRQVWEQHKADLGLVLFFAYVVALAYATAQEIAAH